MTIGIYLLKFNGTDKVYVGQSLRIEERFSRHKLRLTKGIANYKLQEAYKLYGMPSLFILLEASEEDDLDLLENEAIEIYNSVLNGFNINSKAGGGGTGLYGEDHGNSRYTNDQVVRVFKLLLNDINSFTYIENITGVSVHTIRDISKGKTHKWLKSLDEDAYTYLISKIGTRTKNCLGDITDMPILVNDLGEERTIYNISQFARDNNLNKSHLSGVINGLRKSHKGWKLKYGKI